jgi:hypothetical protein
MPTRGEWDAQRTVVGNAIESLERKGVKAQGHVLATRKATEVDRR